MHDKTLLWLAPWQNPSGYCSEALAFARALTGRRPLEMSDIARNQSPEFVAGLPENMQALLRQGLQTQPSVAGKIVVQHLPGSGFAPLPAAAFCAGRTMFETDRLPLDWVRKCNLLDEVWVPSRFNLETFAASGVAARKLKVLPEAADETLFDPASCQPLDLPGRAACNFLSLFEWSARKGWDVLLAAYLREFSAEDDVCLHLRVYPTNRPDAGPDAGLNALIRKQAERLGLGNKPLPRIEILSRQIPTRDLPRLYLAADCLVAPSRGEGWGRPHHEAMMMGRPVIATNWSGNTEFMTAENSYLLDYELVEATEVEPEFAHYRGHRWALASEPHLRRLLRRVEQNPQEARERGRKAREHVLEHFSLEPVGRILVERLADIERNLSTPACPAILARSNEPEEPGKTVAGPVKVAWEGAFLDWGSLAHVNRELTGRLAQNPDIRLACVATTPTQKPLPASLEAAGRRLAPRTPAEAQIVVRHAWPPDWKAPDGKPLVIIQPWEFGALPADWVRAADDVAEFWVPSDYVRRVYVDSGIEPAKIKIVPNGIDPEVFRPEAPSLRLATERKFKLLFVGGTIHRKGPDALLEAYLRTFSPSDDVCLVIKDVGTRTSYAGQNLGAKIKALAQKPGVPEILYLEDDLPPDSLPGLYTACDCLVHPYRGEGFGLPVLEAMACGLPVVVTGGGSTDDFADDTHAWRIPARHRPLGDTVGGFKLARGGWFLEPDLPSLIERLRWIFDHREAARAKGLQASAFVRREWTWEAAARIAARRIQSLAERHPPARPAPRQRPPAAPPACAQLGALQTARVLQAQNDLRGAWKTVLDAIRVRPFHPEACLLLAEIASAAGDSAGARACAEYARDLAPGWKAPKQFLRQAGKPAARPDWLALPDAPARHATGDTTQAPALTVCVIARNEERFLGQCLASVRPLAHQIIVVDTGSTDRTKEIAREFGAEVYEQTWSDDFSAARNAALERARGDWVLMLDADEELPPDQHDRLRKDIRNRNSLALRLPLANCGQETEGCSYVPRLFRNAPGACFQGRIHEQIFPTLIAWGKPFSLGTGLGTARIRHHGYAKDLVRDRNKIDRNLRLLRLAIEEDPGDANLVMNLGLELVRSGDLAAGLDRYREAFRLMSAQGQSEVSPELREALLTQFTSHLYQARAHAEVVSVLGSPLARNAGLTSSLHFVLGLACFELKQHREAAEQMRRCLAKRGQPALSPVNTDILTAAPHHCLALSLAQAGDATGAERAFRDALADRGQNETLPTDFARFLARQGRAVEALEKLHEVVTANTARADAWRLGGQIALSRPDFLEFACDWTAEAAASQPGNSMILAQRAEALMLSQHAAAKGLWEQLCRQEPQPGALAALLLCTLTARNAAVDDESAPALAAVEAMLHNSDPMETSRAFIEWYRKCLAAGARETILAIHDQAARLSEILPPAGQLVAAVAAEAGQPAEFVPA